MITQCSIRHLYALPTSEALRPPVKENLIALAKTMERRRCNHHELDDPLSTLECLSTVIDPKGSRTNKNRYTVASQEDEVRRYCRGLKAVPLLYVKRSVMVMEPMSEGSVGVRESAEKEKFRQGLRGRVAGLGKRKRDNEGSESDDGGKEGASAPATYGEARVVQKNKKVRGPKEPNPLSVRKPKKDVRVMTTNADAKDEGAKNADSTGDTASGALHIVDAVTGGETGNLQTSTRKKKRRRQKSKSGGVAIDGGDEGDAEKREVPVVDIGEGSRA